jgi:hypothetical protein
MRNSIIFLSVGAALAAGMPAAQAQTLETVIVPQPGGAVIAQGVVPASVVPPPGVVVVAQPAPAVAVPVRTVETIRTVQTIPRATGRRSARAGSVTRVTTTRTATVATAPAAAAAYDELLRGPPLYDVVGPVPGVAPAVAQPVTPVAAGPAPIATPAPAYRYVYQPDRILVVDPYTGVAVKVLPR